MQEASDQAAEGAEAEITAVWERHAEAQQALHATLAQLDSASAQVQLLHVAMQQQDMDSTWTALLQQSVSNSCTLLQTSASAFSHWS